MWYLPCFPVGYLDGKVGFYVLHTIFSTKTKYCPVKIQTHSYPGWWHQIQHRLKLPDSDVVNMCNIITGIHPLNLYKRLFQRPCLFLSNLASSCVRVVMLYILYILPSMLYIISGVDMIYHSITVCWQHADKMWNTVSAVKWHLWRTCHHNISISWARNTHSC